MLSFKEKISELQKELESCHVDGWLIFDFRGNNRLLYPFLELRDDAHLTRRFFYWIPRKGVPILIVHAIETHSFDHVLGERRIYSTLQSLEEILRKILGSVRKIAMEYSPQGHVPTISKVDGGTLEWIRSFGVEVVSSGNFLQMVTCVWDEEQYQKHLVAKQVLLDAIELAWRRIEKCIQEDVAITEWDVQQFILGKILEGGCETFFIPVCAVGPHSAIPHYTPEKEGCFPIQRGNFVLIDVGCKVKQESVKGSPYADITRTALIHPGFFSHKEGWGDREKEIFSIVLAAHDAAVGFLKKRFQAQQGVSGFEVDQVCRQVIVDAGYGDFFIHRTGHNIHVEIHGPGANIDSIETLDDRLILKRTCFSIEPGIYLPGEFGVRLENDVFISQEGEVVVTTGEQKSLKMLAP